MATAFVRLLSLRRSRDVLMDYEKAKRMAADPDPAVRRKLAGREDVQPEILYFLAEDESVDVRRLVAANESTPVQADLILASDRDDDVRCHVAEKVARLAPHLSREQQAKVGAIAVQILETLARDELPRVRRMLAEELKAAKNVPATVITTLANDDDIGVSAPVLEHSPLLSDAFLKQLIDRTTASGALAAVSRRTGLSGDLSDAVAATGDDAAIAALLANSSAQIREETLDRLVEASDRKPNWQAPLVDRPKLSPASIRKLSSFVAEALLDKLRRRKDIDPDTARHVADAMQRRIDVADAVPAGGKKASGAAIDAIDDWDSSMKHARGAGGDAEARAEGLFNGGALDEKCVVDALSKGDKPFVIAALALLTGIARPAVQKAVTLESAKGMTALAWKAGLSAAAAVQLQVRLSRIAPSAALKPRDGKFPLTADEMTWHLEFIQN